MMEELMAGESHPLVLFDVDGTLVRTVGSSRHSRAFRAAFERVFGGECRFAAGMHGMTDLQIFMILGQSAGAADGQLREKAMRACRTMVEIYSVPAETDGSYAALPGALTTLEELVRRQMLLGLVTGNDPEIARHKLASAGLFEYFPFGAYGTEAEDRSALPPLAIARAELLTGHSIERSRVFVVGDTPRDVACALDTGCRAVGVATGNFSMEELRAAGAELVLPDLQEPEPLLCLLEKARGG